MACWLRRDYFAHLELVALILADDERLLGLESGSAEGTGCSNKARRQSGSGAVVLNSDLEVKVAVGVRRI